MPAESAAQFEIDDARTNLSRIVDRVENGEEIVICRAGTPVAKIVGLPRQPRRAGRGSLRGLLARSDEWDSDEVNGAIVDGFGLGSTTSRP